MTRRLILIRHAKSDWSGDTADHDRPLNPRGWRSARAMGTWLADGNIRPRIALVSTARRAVETWDGIAAAFDTGPAIAANRRSRLYHASPAGIVAEIARRDEPVVAVVGHNPGFAELASWLCAAPPDHPDFARYPTCATLVVDFDVDTWAAIDAGRGRAVAFQVPRALGGQ